jgi:hypothetical protein
MPKKILNFKDSPPEQGKLEIVDPELRKIEGVVMSGKEPLIGANVLLKDSFAGTITDKYGRFTLTVSGKQRNLVVSYTGLKSRELYLTNDYWDKKGNQIKPITIQLERIK